MFKHPALDFGSIFEFEGKDYTVDQRDVVLMQPKSERGTIQFMDLEEGDIFKTYNPDGTQMVDEYGNDTFLVVDAPYQDELGMPCINVRPYRFTNETTK